MAECLAEYLGLVVVPEKARNEASDVGSGGLYSNESLVLLLYHIIRGKFHNARTNRNDSLPAVNSSLQFHAAGSGAISLSCPSSRTWPHISFPIWAVSPGLNACWGGDDTNNASPVQPSSAATRLFPHLYLGDMSSGHSASDLHVVQ